ncbi:transporter [Tsukamurella sputi]|uniref:Transporter n=1 Tax=Tsukamurella sputi TaxID=2591848 RepID=A0A5C5RVS8_9ACTN|nr:transporter [Tsukamurella sputi]TWS26305.1 transporter [Tsukamurella sputi]
MKDYIFLASDVWLIVVGFVIGWKFIRKYDNYLIGIESLVVGVSATNFLVGSLLGGTGGTPLQISFFLDAFSRSFGFTVILVMGLMAVTHRYRPSTRVEIAAFGITIIAAFFLRHFHDDELHVGVATFYLVMNLLTTAFLTYFAKRLWEAGARGLAIAAALVTAAATGIALTYDFFPFSFDDANRTYFYTAALTVWGAQGAIYYLSYKALHAHSSAEQAARELKVVVA